MDIILYYFSLQKEPWQEQEDSTDDDDETNSNGSESNEGESSSSSKGDRIIEVQNIQRTEGG